MHALSLGTWWIHVSSVVEWLVAIFAVQAYGRRRGEPGWRWLARLCRIPGLPGLLEVSYRIFLLLRPTLQKFQRGKSSK